jgi:hypothetical protein
LPLARRNRSMVAEVPSGRPQQWEVRKGCLARQTSGLLFKFIDESVVG